MQYVLTQGAQGICPQDWHIPTTSEFIILRDYLGGSNVAGGKLKEAGFSHWDPPNTGATNESGFTGLPGGLRTPTYFNPLGWMGHFWSSSQDGSISAFRLALFRDSAEGSIGATNKELGISIRCIKD